MSVTGLALFLFLTFHACMNVVALISGEAYNLICEFLGANWYALVGTAALAALAVVHILYAFLLTYQNRKARGNNRYAVTAKPEKVEWASQNMLVLGIIDQFSEIDSTSSSVKLGIADGKYHIPDDINQYDDQIAEMFGVLP